MLEKTLESPLDCKEIQPVHLKGDQSWVFTGRTDAKAETPIFGHLMRKVDLLEKTLMLGGTAGRRRRGQQRMRWLDGITDSMNVSLIPELGRSPGGGNSNPFQYSCLENPMNRGVLQATVRGIPKNWEEKGTTEDEMAGWHHQLDGHEFE